MMKYKPTVKTTGLGLVELLISLAITAMLLTSVGMAFHASLKTVDENQEIASATRSVRIILHRMMAEVRRAEAVQCQTNRISILPNLAHSSDPRIEYEWINGTLWYSRVGGASSGKWPILGPADGVVIEQFNIGSQTALDGEGAIYTKSITVSMDVQVDSNHFTVTASTNPRSNLDW